MARQLQLCQTQLPALSAPSAGNGIGLFNPSTALHLKSGWRAFPLAQTKRMILTQRIGDTKTHSVKLAWDGRAFAPGAGWHLIFTVKANKDTDTDAEAKIQKTSGAGLSVNASTASVEIVPQDSDGSGSVPDLSPGSYDFDIQARHLTTGEIRTVADGQLVLTRDTTRSAQTTVPIYTTNPPLPVGIPGPNSVTSATTSDGTANLSLATASVSGTLTAPHIHGNLAGSVYMHVRAGEALSKGDPVYVSGSHGSGASMIPIVMRADASNPAKMPAIAVMDAAVTINSNGHAVISGTINDFDTQSYSVNATLYVANGGGMTATKPANAQPVAWVDRSNQNNGGVIVKIDSLYSDIGGVNSVYYFTNAANDGSWANLSNWSLDSTGTQPATSLPSDTSNVVISAGKEISNLAGAVKVHSLLFLAGATLNDYNALNSLTSVTPAVFHAGAGVVVGRLIAEAHFTGGASGITSDGIIDGNAFFFTASHVIEGTIKGNVYLHDLAQGGLATVNGSTFLLSDYYAPGLTGDVAGDTVAAAAKTTPANNDLIPLVDSADSNLLKKLTWANLRSALQSYFSSFFAPLLHTHTSAQITDATNLATANRLVLRDANGGAKFASDAISFAAAIDATKSGAYPAGFFTNTGAGSALYGGGSSGQGLVASTTYGSYHATFGANTTESAFIARLKGAFGWERSGFTARMQCSDFLAGNYVYTFPSATGTVILDTTTTFDGAKSFTSTTRPTSAGTGTPATNSLITSDDAMTYFLANSFFPLVTSFTASGSGHSMTAGPCTHSFGWAGAPVAGVSYLTAGCANVPLITRTGIDYTYLMGSGYGGLIDMGADFTFSFSLITRNVAYDNIFRFAVGRSALTSTGKLGTCTHGFGVRISKKAGSTTIFEMRLCGSTQNLQTDVITGATNTSPIVITNPTHNLQNGDTVEITGCLGNTAANGIFTVANRTSTTFELLGSAGNGTWTSGGSIHRITAPVEFTAGQPLRVFLTNTWATTGTVQLRVGSLSATPSLTLDRLNPSPRTSTNSIVGQQTALRFGLESVTDASANLGFHLGNMFFLKPLE